MGKPLPFNTTSDSFSGLGKRNRWVTVPDLEELQVFDEFSFFSYF
jgi:hypothetical protein